MHFLETLLPELEFQIDVDQLDMQADVAWARVPGPPPELAQRLADWRCRGVRSEFSLVGTTPGEVLFKTESVAPFICKSTWPAVLPERLHRLTTRPGSIQARYWSPFSIAKGGNYLFSLETYAGSGSLTIDGKRRDAHAHTPVQLDPGLHELEVRAEFAPMATEPVIRLVWSGPDTEQRLELMPFYRIAPLDPSCPAAAGQAPITAAGAAPRKYRYLTDWLSLGPFDSPDGSGIKREFIDVAQLSLDPRAAAAGRHWAPIPARDSFIDLDGFYASSLETRSPQWVCAYAATSFASEGARGAFLELAGSGDALQVWLNGGELTAAPVRARYEPMRRPIDLRAGPNLLVLKSCEQMGAWYFVARITDADGNDLPGLQTAAVLPTEPIPLAVTPSEQTAQLIEGIQAVDFAPNRSQSYGDYRGGGPSAWAYVADKDPYVTWRTAPLAERRPTILALTASTSPENGEAELYVNERAAVPFSIGTQGVGGRWSANGFHVAFVSKGFHEGNSGILLITVPPEVITPGEPLLLKVALTSGAPRTWFMIKSYPDTVAYEELTARDAEGELHSTWEPAPTPRAGRGTISSAPSRNP
jgi:hypothetical protein